MHLQKPLLAQHSKLAICALWVDFSGQLSHSVRGTLYNYCGELAIKLELLMWKNLLITVRSFLNFFHF